MSNLDSVIKDINSKYKQQLVVTGAVSYNCIKIPFSSPRANYMTYGGIPLGRVIEFAGEENGGKTTTALDLVGNAQKYFLEEYNKEVDRLNNTNKLTKEQTARLNYLLDRGPRKVTWVDAENTFDDTWASQLGVDVDNLVKIVPQEQYAEEIFEMCIELLNTGDVGFMVLDSLGILMSKQQYEKNIEDKTYGGIAMALTRFSKELCMICGKQKASFIGINQLRDDMNSMYGGTTTPGGKAWKHHCSLRVMFRKGSLLDNKYKEVPRKTESPFGHIVMMDVAKTKICKPNRKQGCYTLIYETGIDKLHDLIDICIMYNCINKAGAWFTFLDPVTGETIENEDGSVAKVQGENAVRAYLETHHNLCSKYEAYVNHIIEDNDNFDDIADMSVYDEEYETDTAETSNVSEETPEE